MHQATYGAEHKLPAQKAQEPTSTARSLAKKEWTAVKALTVHVVLHEVVLHQLNQSHFNTRVVVPSTCHLHLFRSSVFTHGASSVQKCTSVADPAVVHVLVEGKAAGTELHESAQHTHPQPARNATRMRRCSRSFAKKKPPWRCSTKFEVQTTTSDSNASQKALELSQVWLEKPYSAASVTAVSIAGAARNFALTLSVQRRNFITVPPNIHVSNSVEVARTMPSFLSLLHASELLRQVHSPGRKLHCRCLIFNQKQLLQRDVLFVQALRLRKAHLADIRSLFRLHFRT